MKSRPAKKSNIAGLGKVRLFSEKTNKNLLIFIHFPLDISPLDFAIESAGDLPEVIRTLLLVLPIKGATICCAQGQNIYVEKRGADSPRCNQT